MRVVGDDREVGGVAADPDEADVPGDPGDGVGEGGDDRAAVEVSAAGACGVAVDLVGLEQVEPAADLEDDALLGRAAGRPGGRGGRRLGVGDDLVDDDAGADRLGKPEPDQELVVLAVLRGLWVGSVPKKAVVSTPPKRSELIPSGILISARGWVAGGSVVGSVTPSQKSGMLIERRPRPAARSSEWLGSRSAARRRPGRRCRRPG